jgi:hypothetical protein
LLLREPINCDSSKNNITGATNDFRLACHLVLARSSKEMARQLSGRRSSFEIKENSSGIPARIGRPAVAHRAPQLGRAITDRLPTALTHRTSQASAMQNFFWPAIVGRSSPRGGDLLP